MHKKDLIDRLISFVGSGSSKWKGQKSFALFLIHYLDNLDIPSDKKYDFWRIEPYLPELMVDAFEQLRTSEDKEVIIYRKMYEEETGHEVPNITDVGEGDILNKSSAVQTTLGFMLKDVTDDGSIEDQINIYCNAQEHVLQQMFDKFVRRVYRRGMGDLVNKSTNRGMGGKFGQTELRTFVCAGRIMFTFARRIDSTKDGYYNDGDKLACNEKSISFVAEDSDPLCLSAGLQSVYADFRTAFDIIDDVINNWPDKLKEQEEAFRASDSISLG